MHGVAADNDRIRIGCRAAPLRDASAAGEVLNWQQRLARPPVPGNGIGRHGLPRSGDGHSAPSRGVTPCAAGIDAPADRIEPFSRRLVGGESGARLALRLLREAGAA